MQKTGTTKEFIKRSKKRYGENTFDYSKTIYKTQRSPIDIICKKHGKFTCKQAVGHLYRGCGCKQCRIFNVRKAIVFTKEKFIEKARAMHGDKYDYSKFIYVTNESKSIIICPIHNEFIQQARSHYRGSGCTICNKRSKSAGWLKKEWTRRALNNTAILYVANFYNDNENFIKIGITIKEKAEQRLKWITVYKFNVIREIKKSPNEIWDLEIQLKEQHQKYSYKPLIDFRGKTECYDMSILQQLNNLI